MDIQRALRTAVATGKVHLGLHQVKKAVESGQARLVIYAQNLPEKDSFEKLAKTRNVPVHEFGGRGTDLGPACGKPFAVSVLAVLDAGESDILQLVR